MEETKAKTEMVEVVAMLDLKPEENDHFFEILGERLVHDIDTHAFVKKHYLDTDMPCYVVKVNGKLIPAYMFYMPISLYGFYGPTPNRDSGECTSIWIHDNHRRKGYGTKLINHRPVEYILQEQDLKLSGRI